MKNEKKDKSDELKNINHNAKEETIHIEGIGSITSIGEYDMEKFIKSLLKSKYITGKQNHQSVMIGGFFIP
jgi:hypothetical protein